jgi:hypothetical protein
MRRECFMLHKPCCRLYRIRWTTAADILQLSALQILASMANTQVWIIKRYTDQVLPDDSNWIPADSDFSLRRYLHRVHYCIKFSHSKGVRNVKLFARLHLSQVLRMYTPNVHIFMTPTQHKTYSLTNTSEHIIVPIRRKTDCTLTSVGLDKN